MGGRGGEGGVLLLWLDSAEAQEASAALVGGKAANLATLAGAGFDVPPAYCLTTAAYRRFLASQGFAPDQPAESLREVLMGATVEPEVASILAAATRELVEERVWPWAATAGQVLLAVRSSASNEDLPHASFAGQGETILGVRGDTEALEAAVRRCWASLWSEQGMRYRVGVAPEAPQMAVLVQQQIPCEVAGIAFTRDPVDGSRQVVIEAVMGLADRLAAGQVAGQHYRYDPQTGHGRREDPTQTTTGSDDLLTEDGIERVAALALSAEEALGRPQDIEWGMVGDRLVLLQSRPITVHASGFFTQRVGEDETLWTSGFFSERLPRPVSPLGWTLIAELLEPLALADPLRFLGVPARKLPPLLRLYRGHPYTNVAVFQMLYAVFPDAGLPADIYRYFPGGDTSMRRQVSYPRSILHPRTGLSLAVSLALQWAAVSPWHNWRAWNLFKARLAGRLRELEAGLDRARHEGERAQGLWQLCRAAQEESGRLLALHRWSLILAELLYTLLKRLLGAWVAAEKADALAARLVVGLPSASMRMNVDLHLLAAGQMSRIDFLQRYGHRSFDLDLAHPTFRDDPEQVETLVGHISRSGAGHPDLEAQTARRQELEEQIRARLSWWQRPVFEEVLRLVQRYMQLREDQRSSWQRLLANQRRVLLTLGEVWATFGWLESPESIFGATLEEVERAATEGAELPSGLIELRRQELALLEGEGRLAPALAYPRFLRGDRPLIDTGERQRAGQLQGLPVSPGLGRGPARVVLSAGDFAKIEPGDVLVTRGADPGWTPLYGVLAGLVLETGGQLSHGAVVAREYGLPAVGGVPGITDLVADGDVVTVDGTAGVVVLDDGMRER